MLFRARIVYTLPQTLVGQETLSNSSRLNEQQMHARIRKENEHAAEDGEANNVRPQSQDVEAEAAQDG